MVVVVFIGACGVVWFFIVLMVIVGIDAGYYGAVGYVFGMLVGCVGCVF